MSEIAKGHTTSWQLGTSRLRISSHHSRSAVPWCRSGSANPGSRWIYRCHAACDAPHCAGSTRQSASAAADPGLIAHALRASCPFCVAGSAHHALEERSREGKQQCIRKTITTENDKRKRDVPCRAHVRCDRASGTAAAAPRPTHAQNHKTVHPFRLTCNPPKSQHVVTGACFSHVQTLPNLQPTMQCTVTVCTLSQEAGSMPVAVGHLRSIVPAGLRTQNTARLSYRPVFSLAREVGGC